METYNTSTSLIQLALFVRADDVVSSVVTPSWSTIMWSFVNCVLFVCILSGNALTIIAVRTCRRLRCLISNLFILSLAASDFVVGVALPYHVSFYLGSNMGNVRGLCLTRFFLIIFACCVSILTLITISIDRYIAILYALHYRRYMTRRVAISAIIFNWAVGATVAVIPMFWNRWNSALQCEFDQILPPWYMAGIITPGFSVIWILMLIMYWRIMKEASKQANQIRNPREKRSSAFLHPDWRSVQVVVFIMGCFSICWLPYFVVACAQIFEMRKTTPLLYKAAFSLAMANSALNPVIYSWKNSNFKRSFVLLIRCKSPNCHQRSLAGSSRLSPTCFKRHSLSCTDSRTNNENVIPGELNTNANHLPTGPVYTVSDPSSLSLH